MGPDEGKILTEQELAEELVEIVELIQSEEFAGMTTKEMRQGAMLGVTTFAARLSIRMGYDKQEVLSKMFGEEKATDILKTADAINKKVLN